MTKKLSIIASGLLLSSTMAFAADSIDGAFKEGKVSGTIDAYYENTSPDTGSDTGYSAGAVGITYETGSYMGLSAKVGFVGATEINSENDVEFESAFTSNSILAESNITYATEGFSLTVGRQAVGLEWAGDYHEAVVAAITAIPDTTLVLAYSDKIGVAGYDGIEDFAKFNGSKGAYIAEATYSGLAGFEFTPYFYSLPDIADTYGLKTVYSSDMFGAVAHYAATSEDNSSDDGSILHLEASASVEGLSFALGYIKTDKDAGVGSIGAGDDNISPFEDGNYVYDADARTVYGTLGYSIAGADLGLIYGETKYGSDKEKELNLTAGYSFTDAFSGSILYGNVSAENSADDYDKVLVNLNYSF